MVAENDQTAPHTNGGSDPVENGVNNVNGTEDVEMAEDDADINGSATQKNQREGGGESDDGMTVVVPPSKGSRLSGEPEQHQHDITMNEAEDGDEAEVEVQVDPREKALSGIIGLIFYFVYFFFPYTTFDNSGRHGDSTNSCLLSLLF